MDPIVWMVIFFVVGVLFSAIETSYTAFDRVLLESWQRAGKYGTRLAKWLVQSPDRFLSTTLVGNNISNVAYASLIVAVAAEAGYSEFAIGFISLASAVVALIFSEIVPKTVAYGFANRLVRPWALPLFICYVIFSPIRWLLLPLTKLVNRRPKSSAHGDAADALKFQSEIEHVLAGAAESDVASKEEGELLSRYMDARDLKVRQIMTPRTELIATNVRASISEVRALFVRHGHNIMPVYDGDLDHIIGYVRARDLLLEPDSLLEIARPILAVPESKLIVDLLKEFRVSPPHVAIVIDEYGGTDGLVTIKDIWEELVGPVAERWDPAEPIVKRIAPGKFLISGASFLEEVERSTGWQAPESEANTLSGLLAEIAGRIPEAGEEFKVGGCLFRVIRRTPRRVEGCLMKCQLEREKTD